MSYSIDLAVCDGCGDCIPLCPTDAITCVEGTAFLREDDCILCGGCQDACPKGAVLYDGERTRSTGLCENCELCEGNENDT